jgi:adenylate cyclase
MPVVRKLVAVVAADVVGYSRLMERDEAGTHERLRKLRDGLIDPKIAEHGGRIVNTSGDGMLLEFPSATSALRCAVEVQRELGARNLYIARDQRIEFRMGINLGDIIVEGADIIGDGVNVAARLEALAEPGGICVASAIREQLHEDLGIEFVDAGEQQVKNISKPIHVYRVALERGVDAPPAGSATAAARKGKAPISRRMLVAVFTLILLGAGIAALWRMLQAGAIPEPLAGAVPLRSVMIVPFTAPPGDPALAAVASQLTVDVTQAFGDSMRDVRVVPSGAAKAYAGKTADAKVIGREASVRFLVEGDARPTGAQVALTLRLVDTIDGRQVENTRKVVDRAKLDDTEAILQQLTSAMRDMVYRAIWRDVATRGSAAASAEDLVDRAFHVSIPDPVDRAREARRLADAAIKLDPNFARAWAILADAGYDVYYFVFSVDRAAVIADADADSLHAVTLDPQDAIGWRARSSALRIRGNLEAAFAANDRAQELDRTRFSTLLDRGWLYLDAGKPAETLKIVDKVRSATGALNSQAALEACMAQVLLGAYDDAIVECERVETDWDNWYRHANLAAAYAMRGDVPKAAQAKDRLLKAVPSFTIARYEARFHPSLGPEAKALDKAHLLAGLRKAGVPE